MKSHIKIGLFAAHAVLVSVAPVALGQTEHTAGSSALEIEAKAEPRSWFGEKSWLEWDRATGDWAGLRPKMIERGLVVEASYMLHWSSVWDGGVNNVASTRHVFDANATLNTETAGWWKGGKFYVDAYIGTNNGGSRDVGDLQGICTMDLYGNFGELAEVWYEHTFADGAVRAKVGKIDASYEFAYVTPGADFLTSSPYWSPTIVGFPGYPAPATGVVAFVYPGRMYFGAGFFDGATLDGFHTGKRGPETFFSDDESASWFIIGEGGVNWSEAAGMGAGRIGLGIHHHTAQLPTYDSSTQDGVTGAYAVGEQQVWRAGDSEDLKGLGAFIFAQAGITDGDVNAIQGHLAAGVTLKGLLESRRGDSAGLYVSWADVTDEPGSGFTDDETAVELYYKAAITPWLNVSPALIYVASPGGGGVDDALVGQLRVEVLF